jgi:two-component system LytT family response regulator
MNTTQRILALHKKKKELQLAILDDDREAIEYISPFVRMTDGVVLAYAATNPEDMFNYLKKNVIHILLLDMEMPKMHGMAFLPQLMFLKKTHLNIADLQVIICTAHHKFAVKSFRYKVTDYLTKPITFDQYLEAIHEVKQRLIPAGLSTLDSEHDYITIALPGGKIRKLTYREIIYLEAYEHKTWLWINSTQYFEVNETFKKFLPRFPKSNFMQVHRSYAISLAHFQNLEKDGIRLRDTDTLVKYARRGGYELFDKWLAENLIRGNLVEKRKKISWDE